MANKLVKLWFKHDYNARNDPKLLEVNMTFGAEGIGIYWMLVELLYEQHGILNNKEIATLIYSFRLDENKVNEIIKLCFISDEDGNVTSQRVKEQIAAVDEKSEKASYAAQKRWNVRVATVPDWMNEEENKKKKTKPMKKEQKENVEKLIKTVFGDDDK